MITIPLKLAFEATAQETNEQKTNQPGTSVDHTSRNRGSAYTPTDKDSLDTDSP